MTATTMTTTSRRIVIPSSMRPAGCRPAPTRNPSTCSTEEPSEPLRQALRDWLELVIREAVHDLPSPAEVALAEAAITSAWRRLGEPLAWATYCDEVRTIHRTSAVCFCCGKRGKLHMSWEPAP